MQIKMHLRELNFGDIAVKVLPLAARSMEGQSGAVAESVAALAGIPRNLIRSVLDAIPVEKQNKIVAGFAEEYRERVVWMFNRICSGYDLGVRISDISVDEDLEIVMDLNVADYRPVAERFLPVIKEKLLTMGGIEILLRPMVRNASAAWICNLMDRILGDQKDAFVASLINQNQRRLIAAIEDAAGKQGIRLRIRDLNVQA